MPEPQVGSSTRSPGSVVIRRQRSTNSVVSLNDVNYHPLHHAKSSHRLFESAYEGKSSRYFSISAMSLPNGQQLDQCVVASQCSLGSYSTIYFLEVQSVTRRTAMSYFDPATLASSGYPSETDALQSGMEYLSIASSSRVSRSNRRHPVTRSQS